MAIINNMPSGGGGGKFKHEVLTDMTHIKSYTDAATNNPRYYIDEDYLGFKPDWYYAVAKFQRSYNSQKYNLSQTLGFMEESGKLAAFFAATSNRNAYPQAPLSISISYISNIVKDERKLILFPQGDITTIEYVEFYAWAK